jgi:hypothetical protein
MFAVSAGAGAKGHGLGIVAPHPLTSPLFFSILAGVERAVSFPEGNSGGEFVHPQSQLKLPKETQHPPTNASRA